MMKYLQIPASDLKPSNIIMGCMRINNLDKKGAEHLIRTAMEAGVNMFDHADIYGDGYCEEFFAEAVGMNPQVREKMILQSKCGIRKGYYDFSKEHILEAVDGSLKRLHTDYLDVLLLHRPDALMEPEETAEALQTLFDAGKVRYFGVSNHNPMQIELLQKYCSQKLVVNQLQFAITHAGMVSNGINVNMTTDAANCRDGSILDYCRLKDITIQPWSPFQYGFFEGVFLDNEKFPELNAVIDRLAEQYQVKNTAIAIASDPVKMACAFADAVKAGRTAYLLGASEGASARASATSPLTGFLK